jgi:hypothetical protein
VLGKEDYLKLYVALRCPFLSLITNSSVSITNAIAIFSIGVVLIATLEKTMAGCRAKVKSVFEVINVSA